MPDVSSDSLVFKPYSLQFGFSYRVIVAIFSQLDPFNPVEIIQEIYLEPTPLVAYIKGAGNQLVKITSIIQIESEAIDYDEPPFL
jgi:hypothetical protein